MVPGNACRGIVIGLLKSIAYFLANPLWLATALALLALLARQLRWPLIARIFAVCAAVILWLGSTSAISHALIRPLEQRYARLDPGPESGFSQVVVLGSGYEPEPGLGSADSLNDDGLRRILEGLRLSTRLKAQLLLSGGAPDASRASALGYERFVREQNGGTCDCRIIAEPLDTAGEARALRKVLGDQQFILVTSAYHMPRAMRHMHAMGLRALPAPTGFSVRGLPITSLWAWIPSASGLERTQRALHEYFGLAAIELLPARESVR
jgi:uncharacterized SAM-binding protein YcdF (DUF218 family)